MTAITNRYIITAEVNIINKLSKIPNQCRQIIFPFTSNEQGEIDLSPIVRTAFENMQIWPNSKIEFKLKDIRVKNGMD